VHLLEEVVLRKEVTERTETVRDTVRRDEVQVEQPTGKALVRHAKA
jgi:stress response protein YsnF